VFVGDASRINLPEIGRIRAGRGRFRGLRWCTRTCATSRSRATTSSTWRCCAWIWSPRSASGPTAPGRPARRAPAAAGRGRAALAPAADEPFFRSTLDPAALIEALEEEFDRVAPAAIATDKRDRALLVVVDIRRPPRNGAPRAPVPAPRAA
jgi:GTP-binding protein HflX